MAIISVNRLVAAAVQEVFWDYEQDPDRSVLWSLSGVWGMMEMLDQEDQEDCPSCGEAHVVSHYHLHLTYDRAQDPDFVPHHFLLSLTSTAIIYPSVLLRLLGDVRENIEAMGADEVFAGLEDVKRAGEQIIEAHERHDE